MATTHLLTLHPNLYKTLQVEVYFHEYDMRRIELYIIICFQQHTTNAIFQNETVSVKSNEQSAKQSWYHRNLFLDEAF